MIYLEPITYSGSLKHVGRTIIWSPCVKRVPLHTTAGAAHQF